MINHVSFRNFKGLRSVEVSLEQFTVFVGPNASGKTSILEGLFYLSQLRDKDPYELFKDDLHPLMLYSRGAQGEMKLEVSTPNGCRRLSVTPPDLPPEHSAYQFMMESANRWQMNAQFNPNVKGEGGWASLGHVEGARQKMSPAVLVQLEPVRLASPSYGKEREPQMARDGSGLASALVRMAGNRPDDFQELQKRLRRIIPSMQKVRFDRAPVRLRASEHDPMLIEYWGDAIVFDFENASNVPARMASDGTLLALAILTVAMAPDRPKLILLDNVENGLHPNAQKELVGLLETILALNPELQIVATTHSPYLVDIVEPEQVRIMTHQKDGSVACGRLTDHPDYEKWKDEMAPGEFWSLIGEKWLGTRKGVVSQQ
jgi:energy-coupling factor transporter ATP-binding protein EcfA2